MRTSPRLSIAATFLILTMFCVGCAASLAERQMLADVKARQLPNVDLSPEIILLGNAKIADNSPFKSLISMDGRAHLFVADEDKQVHHVEVSGNEVLLREILGVMEDPARYKAVDAVEHPAGNLRVLAGDKQFIRAASDQKWQEIKGNRCARFITAGDDLLCAFIANGKDIATPKRTDYFVGLFYIIPVVWWWNVDAEKLVLAQESKNGWIIRAVVDPETELSPRSDFTVEKDRQGVIHFLYRASGGSTGFIVLQTPGGNVYGGGNASEGELCYARVQYDQLLSRVSVSGDTGSGSGKPPAAGSSIQGQPLAPMPFVTRSWTTPVDPSSFWALIAPLDRHFALNVTSGDLGGLIWAYGFKLKDETRKIEYGIPCAHIKIREGQWVPSFDIVTVNDTDSRYIDGQATREWSWRDIFDPLGTLNVLRETVKSNLRVAMIKSDSKGCYHILLTRGNRSSWSRSHDIGYFVKTGSDWSAPLILGSGTGWHGDSLNLALALDETGKVFAAWKSESNRVVGRWIIPKK